jgi:TonB family protein
MRRASSFAVVLLTAVAFATPVLAERQANQEPVRPGPGITSPKLVQQVPPVYPPSELGRKISGEVALEAIIGVSGIPTAIRVTRSFSTAFDAAAVDAARQWRFTPGLDAAGRAVPVIVSLVVTFKPSDATGEDPEFLTALSPGNGISSPVLIRHAEPKYTSVAMQAKIEGIVELDVVVRVDGTVGAVKVVKSLDRQFGLDGEAIKAAKLWQFKPGTDRAGTPVPVRVRLILEFRSS